MKVRFAKFALVGAVGTAVQLALLALLLKHTRLSAVSANTLAVELTLLHNFVWHEFFTWQGRSSPLLNARARRLWRFHLGNGVVSLVGNALLTYAFVNLLRLPPLPSALLAIGMCSVANFLLADRWIYLRV